MKLLVHDRVTKPTSLVLATDPMSVWLDKFHELIIERGDRLIDVTALCLDRLPLDLDSMKQLVAFWFALGERQAGGIAHGPLSTRELRVKTGRRYLASSR